MMCFLAGAFLAAPVASPLAADLGSGTPITIGVSHEIRSRILAGSRELNVWVPAGYAPNKERYAVLYVLDGGIDQDFRHIAGLGQLGELSETFETLIVVGVRTYNRQRELTPPPHDPRFVRSFPQSGGAAEFRSFLTDEVVPFIEARYRTAPRRALMGESLAGLFVVDTFLAKPEAFDDYIAVSPSLWWDARALTRQAPDLLSRYKPGNRRLYLTMANEGGVMRAGMDELIVALKNLALPGLSWRFVDRSTSETHATIYHTSALDALRSYYQRPQPDGPPPWFMIEGASPPPAPP
jgi:predicted alpha/beta superfamily hydrolase